MINLNKKEQAVIIVVTGIILCGIVYRSFFANFKEVEVVNDNDEMPQVQQEEYIYVHVAGAVLNPGVYRLQRKSRTIDAIMAAGGGNKDSDIHRLNLVKALEDGEKITVPIKVIVPKGNSDEQNQSPESAEYADNKININTASLSQLDSLPGIGLTKAQDIISYRQQSGGFKQIEDIKKVNGIGDKIFERIKDMLEI